MPTKSSFLPKSFSALAQKLVLTFTRGQEKIPFDCQISPYLGENEPIVAYEHNYSGLTPSPTFPTQKSETEPRPRLRSAIRRQSRRSDYLRNRFTFSGRAEKLAPDPAFRLPARPI